MSLTRPTAQTDATASSNLPQLLSVTCPNMLLPLLGSASISIDPLADEHGFESGVTKDYASREQTIDDGDPDLQQTFGL